jgi:hypothetical protein
MCGVTTSAAQGVILIAMKQYRATIQPQTRTRNAPMPPAWNTDPGRV